MTVCIYLLQPDQIKYQIRYKIHMKSTTKAVLLVAIVLVMGIEAAATKAKAKQIKIQSGKLYLQVKQTPTSSAQMFQFAYDSSMKSQLKLTQSSKIEIEAKMKFGSQSFDPQLFSFRLVHPNYDKLTQPVQAVYDTESQSWKCIIDLGDPRVIQPYSDLYRLQLIIADEKLPQNVRNTIATIRISFRYSITEDKIPNNHTPVNYKPQNVIRTNPPEARVDPPAIFTFFLLFIMSILTAIFYYGIFVHLKANLRQLPSDGVGFLLNLGLISLLTVNLVFLGKFWFDWNFITTIVNFFWLTIATALVGNYALLYLKNKV